MAVRPAGDEVLVEERRTRIESPKGPAADRDDKEELWDLVESLNDADWANQQYKFRIERGKPEWKSEDRTFVELTFEKRMPADIKRLHGGGEYTIWFYGPPKGQQLKKKKLLKIDGPPNAAPPAANGAGGANSVPGDPVSQLIFMIRDEMRGMRDELKLARGGDASTRAVEQAVALTGSVFSAATQAATGTLTNIAGGGGTRGALEERLLNVMLERLLAPQTPTDPIDTFAKMLERMKALGLGGPAAGGDGANPTTHLIAEGIRALPQVVEQGVRGLEQWRLAEQFRFATVSATRGVTIDATPGAPGAPPRPPGAVPPPSVSAAPPPAPGGAPPANPSGGSPVSIEHIERALVNILNNPTLTIEECAHRAAALMEDMAPGMPDQLAAAGEQQILGLFNSRPILKQHVPMNPRLTEFVKKFIEVVKGAPVPQQPNPHAPPA